MAAGDLMPGPKPGSTHTGGLPEALNGCLRVVAVTVHLPEFLLSAAGLIQRFGDAGIPVDVLVSAASDHDVDEAAALGLKELRVADVSRHRLALPAPFGSEREDDLVAAMSELVGFDPEPGVVCLAPDADCSDPSRTTVRDAARRIASVYKLPLLRFAAMPDEASVSLELDQEEWARKCAGLAACATQVTPLSGRLEYFAL
ncbi:hypothetical protein [Pseudonocardia spinosispora]|uniref:hypothetical protein n=1 Tax=Pseudonocardia spinosispora TaxID=103441 RepID=UPI0003FCD30F|nr:hypothetical protein [Pseudonocardia spinosispora]